MPRRSTRHAASQANTTALGSTYIRASQDIRPPPPPASDSGNTASQASPARRSARIEGSQNALLQAPPTNDDYPSDDETIVPFRLMDLPAEIRNRIYSRAFASHPKRDISYFAIPPLTLASKQLRSESLPIFFAETHFRLIVAGNFYAHLLKRRGQNGARLESLRSPAGTLGSSRLISSHLKAAGNAAFFRHLTFEVYDAAKIKDVRREQRQSASEKWLTVDVVVKVCLEVGSGGALTVAVEDGREHPRRLMGKFGPIEDEVGAHVRFVDDAAEMATAIAQNIADQDDEFKGFKMSDLRKIAKAFRLE